MLNIKDFSNKELDKQITECEAELDELEYGTGDYTSILAELEVAKKEKARRERKYLVSNTTKVERETFVKEALAVSQLGGGSPDDETMKLFQEYINGTMEISEVQKRVIKKAKLRGRNNEK